MLATTTDLKRFMNKVQKVMTELYDELTVCAMEGNHIAVNYNEMPFIVSFSNDKYNEIVFYISRADDSLNYIAQNKYTCGNQMDVVWHVWYFMNKYYESLKDNEETKETASNSETEKHYYDYTSEDFIKAGIAKECTTCPDFCEEDCVENAECASGYDVFDGCKTVKDDLQPNKTIIENINHCPNQNTCCIVSPFAHCDYKYKSDSCIKAHNNFIHDCDRVHKQMKAINNPNWHTVRLATVNSSDFFRLNEKLKLYISLYRDLQQTLSYLRKCKTLRTYDICILRYIKKVNARYAEKKISKSMLYFMEAKISMQNAESGIWDSENERATGCHKSRRYNKNR